MAEHRSGDTRRAILTLGWIPRGVGKAPRATRPEAVAVREPEVLRAGFAELARRLAAYRERVDLVGARRTGARHPYFGVLAPARWMRFTAVHLAHHLKIVDDILGTAPGDDAGPDRV